MSDMRPARVLHLIPHLGQGGAEACLAALLACHQPDLEQAVCTLIAKAPHFDVPVPLYEGTGQRGVASLSLALHVRRSVRNFQPDLLHCWMYHANLLSLAALGTGTRILWSIHGSRPDRLPKSMTRVVSATCARLSGLVPDRIIYVANSARAEHEALGYVGSRGVVIPNGVDLDRFHPSATIPLSSDIDRPLRLGLVARYDPEVKGHHFFIDVLAKHPLRDKVELVMAGDGCDAAPALRAHLARVGLLPQTRLIGPVGAVERLYAELDILVLPSRSEALPMVVLEAAAMGLVVCASQVGDIPLLGLPQDALFKPGDQDDCARALGVAARLARRPDEALRQRARVESRFGITAVARRYRTLYQEVAQI